MPTEPRTDGFITVANGQSLSYFQLQTHLAVVDKALDEAFRRATSKPDEWTKELSARQLARRDPRRRCREPEMLSGKAVVWSTRTIFYGRLPVTTAREDGWYRLRIKASALNVPDEHGVWCTVRTGMCVSSAPMLAWAGGFEATEEPNEWTFEAWLPRGHMFEVRPGDSTLKMGRFSGGQIGGRRHSTKTLRGCPSFRSSRTNPQRPWQLAGPSLSFWRSEGRLRPKNKDRQADQFQSEGRCKTTDYDFR